MLYIYFGRIDYDTAPIEMVANIDEWFDMFMEDSWTDNEWAKKVIKEIDEADLVNPKTIISPVLGTLPIDWLSGGSKNLIMMNSVSGIVYNGNNLGDNCWPLLLELSKTRDIMIRLAYYPTFEWTEGVAVSIINDSSQISSFHEFSMKTLKFVDTESVPFSQVHWPIEVKTGVLVVPDIEIE